VTYPEHICDKCGQPLMLTRYGVRLSPKEAAVLDHIKHRGGDGIGRETLAWIVYPDKPKEAGKAAISVHINRINGLLSDAGINIKADHLGTYRVRSDHG